jgi:hypothetical protein
MTPYRDRSQAGEFEPKSPPKQPKDTPYTVDPVTGKAVKAGSAKLVSKAKI